MTGQAPAKRPNQLFRNLNSKIASIPMILIALGMMFLAGQLGLFSWFAWRYFWPLVLIGIGAGLLFRQNAWRR